ncbi:MAG: carbon storage regulator [Isosphaerales bacterium]
MLVLSRKCLESVVVGQSRSFAPLLKVTVLEIKNDRVRLGFEAPAEFPVHRSEVWERIRAAGEPDGTREDTASPMAG